MQRKVVSTFKRKKVVSEFAGENVSEFARKKGVSEFAEAGVGRRAACAKFVGKEGPFVPRGAVLGFPVFSLFALFYLHSTS